MADRGMRSSRWRSVLLVGAGMVLGSTLITPAAAQVGVADVTDEMRHFWRHYIKRQVLLLGNITWLGINATAVNANLLDGLDSTQFLGAGAKAADAELLDGINSTSFLRTSGAGSKAADSELLDGINSTDFLRTSGTGSKAADSELLDGINSTSFLRTSGAGSKAADSELLDGLNSTDFVADCTTGAVKAFAIIDGFHTGLTEDGPFVNTPILKVFNCTGDGLLVRRTPTADGGGPTGIFQLDFGAETTASTCPREVVSLTPGPDTGLSQTDNIVSHVQTRGYLRACPSPPCAVIRDCFIEVEIRDVIDSSTTAGTNLQNGIFTIVVY